jgi:nitrous oxide reductase accessory protein NosL
MYGLKEAAIITFNQLVKKLAPHGYAPAPFTPGLWRHNTKRTTFVLCVDDFGVKYFSQPDAQHLIDALKAHYELTIDWSGALYCGLMLD